ncbi:uncharacterized protein LOC62_03G003770 [Vanrija pseudolonga]|uniref:Tyrosine specific protein phosphatases domain-containing protein n=1 Tax=Vanrija pseudolonga TaxID=143232 RepID=A0AAF0Y551_9TREE|nr:hypothetical protein LOC62_03G003770 [Vanrija pseudolonga]
MSRTATATPPPPLFHQKNATPSARHVSKGNGSQLPVPGFQRHFKKQSKLSHSAVPPTSSSSSATAMDPPPLNPATNAAAVAPAGGKVPMSASDMLGMGTPRQRSPDPMAMSRTGSISWSFDDSASAVPSMSTSSSASSDSCSASLTTPETTPSSSIYGDHAEIVSGSTTSFPNVPIATPSPRSWVNGFGKMARAAISPFSRRREGESPRLPSSPAQPISPSPGLVGMSPYIAPSPQSFSPMSTPASPMAFTITPAPEVAQMSETTPLPLHALPPAVAVPSNMPPAITPGSPEIDNPVEALRRAEWAELQQKRVTEFARLCSQWPQSGYNLGKWGPNGCPSNYVPQSWANPRQVVRTMQRQAELERKLCDDDSTFFASAPTSTRSSSTDESVPSTYSFVSTSQTSLATSVSAGTINEQQDNGAALCAAVWQATSSKAEYRVERRSSVSADASFKVQTTVEQQTAEDIRVAMSSPLVDGVQGWRGEASIISVSSMASVATSIATSAAEDKDDSKWGSLANSTKSLSELDQMANLATTDRMDVDEPEPLSSIPSVPGSHPESLSVPPVAVMSRPTRSASCPAKRPLTFVGDDDEDKRRKVDEPMAVDTPVLTDEPAALTPPPSLMTGSVPNLLVHPAIGAPMLFGHAVKTSASHPIVISPFIPNEIMATLGNYLLADPNHDASTPLLLGSELDVPSLLLSCPPPNQCASEAGPVTSGRVSPTGPRTLISSSSRPRGSVRQPTQLGNLLLSSCPGKRLRMDGPVKGRGPVCRDLATDLRRIKGAGVGAIVCCLDNEELELLGVPWDTYRELASDIGLDVIRLPMPDGFTPVSLQLFDAQVSLIATKYTLKGINVLVHCRGGIGRAGLTACAWAIKMGFVQPHPTLAAAAEQATVVSAAAAAARSGSKSGRKSSKLVPQTPSGPNSEEEHCVVMSVVERVIAMIRSRRGLKAIETYEQVQFLATYVAWLRETTA